VTLPLNRSDASHQLLSPMPPALLSPPVHGIMGVLVPHRPPGLVGLFHEELKYLCLTFGLPSSLTTKTCT
jgi:hypothetical protein